MARVYQYSFKVFSLSLLAHLAHGSSIDDFRKEEFKELLS